MKKLRPDEVKAFKDERRKFLDYKNIEEYIEDIVTCLVYSPWHYTETEAREQCDERMALIERAFQQKEPAQSCSVDVGYCCG